MREICAASDFDFIAAEPRPKSHGAKRGKAKKKRAASAFFVRLRAMGRYVTPFLGVAALAVLLGAVVVNAMFLQHGRHPAPLLGSTIRIEPPKPAARPVTIDSLLAERLPAKAPAAPEAEMLAPPPPVALAPVAAPAAPVKKSHDAIGALLSGGSQFAAPGPSKGVMSAQRALQKLGAPVKLDGDFGAATRKAVEAFQRKNGLAVTGELTVKTKRLLSARSGVSLE